MSYAAVLVALAQPADAPPAPAEIAPVTASTATAEGPAYHTVPFDIGLFPAASINGRHKGKEILNNFSIAFLWSKAARVEGMAWSLGITVVTDGMEGVAASYVGNINKGEMKGVQAAAGFNTARHVRGVQASSFFNYAKRVHGAQFSLVNVAGRVRGAQFGLVNVADEADASFALVPITRKGGIHPEVFTSDTAMLGFGIRLPAKYTYGFASVGLHPVGRGREGELGTNLDRGKAWEAGVGFGGHIPLAHGLYIDMDLGAHVVTGSLAWKLPVGNLGRARLLVGWQAAKRLAVWGGPTLNVLVDDPDRGIDRPGYGWVAGAWENTAVRVRVWPGFAAGLRF
jgi:hypothetical protein